MKKKTRRKVAWILMGLMLLSVVASIVAYFL